MGDGGWRERLEKGGGELVGGWGMGVEGWEWRDGWEKGRGASDECNLPKRFKKISSMDNSKNNCHGNACPIQHDVLCNDRIEGPTLKLPGILEANQAIKN